MAEAAEETKAQQRACTQFEQLVYSELKRSRDTRRTARANRHQGVCWHRTPFQPRRQTTALKRLLFWSTRKQESRWEKRKRPEKLNSPIKFLKAFPRAASSDCAQSLD